MSKHFFVFGNHPALAFAELISAMPDAKILVMQERAAVVETSSWNGEKLMGLLGGTVKLGDITVTSNVENLKSDVVEFLLESREPKKEKKPTDDAERFSLDFGWTVFASDKNKKSLEKFPMGIKKELKESGASVRWVTGEEGKEISPAAVAKCKLIQQPNADLVIIGDEGGKGNEEGRKKKEEGGTVYVGRTTHVQNADVWSERDYGRPRRDDRGGMLPPKLARMMVNLAKVPKKGTVIDPFCGSGTVLMEAALATDASRIMGSDIAQRCIQDTQTNNDWLIEKGLLEKSDGLRFAVFQCDARSIDKKIQAHSIDAVVTEGWLGPPLRGDETEEHLQGIAQEVGDVWRKALAAIRPTLKDNATVVMVLPSYKADGKVIMPGTINDLGKLGYELKHPLSKLEQRPPALYYQRPDQHVRRNILVIKPKDTNG